MRVSKKNVFLIILFIVSLGLIYLIVSSFYFTSLHFKYFYELNETSNVAENKVIYTIMDNENIVYLNKKKDKIIIEQIEPNNVKPELIFEIEIPSNELETYSFIKKGTCHYFFYNSNKSLIIIDIANKKYTFMCHKDANKVEIKKAIESIFGVKVESVNTSNVKGKLKSNDRGRTQGYTASYKKAIVTLTRDSKSIEFFDSLS